MIPSNRKGNSKMWQNNKPRVKWLSACLAILLVLALTAGCGKKTQSVVATYKDGQITKAEFDKYIGVVTLLNPYFAGAQSDPSFQDAMLKQMTTMKILYSRASDKSKKDG